MPSKYSGIELLSIRITDDSSYFDNKYGITESVQELIQDIYFEVGKGKKHHQKAGVPL